MSSCSFFIRSPSSKNVFTCAFASLVEFLEAFAIIVAKNDDALSSSIDDSYKTVFISYLNDFILCMFSIGCFFDVVFTFGLYLLLLLPPAGLLPPVAAGLVPDAAGLFAPPVVAGLVPGAAGFLVPLVFEGLVPVAAFFLFPPVSVVFFVF